MFSTDPKPKPKAQRRATTESSSRYIPRAHGNPILEGSKSAGVYDMFRVEAPSHAPHPSESMTPTGPHQIPRYSSSLAPSGMDPMSATLPMPSGSRLPNYPDDPRKYAKLPPAAMERIGFLTPGPL